MDRTAEEMRALAFEKRNQEQTERRQKSMRYVQGKITSSANYGKRFVKVTTNTISGQRFLGDLAIEDVYPIRDELVNKGYHVSVVAHYSYGEGLMGLINQLVDNGTLAGYTLDIHW